MTPETKKEVIKALAYGLGAATVADCNGVTLAEVEAVAEKEAVAAKRAELREVYPDGF